jgi:creatinine amidohydrolase
MEHQVCIERLMPAEIEQAMAQNPVLYQPLGTVEWHGLHNWVGLDSIKAHELCRRAALLSGGLVAPPLYGGVGGLHCEHTFIIDSSEEHSVYTRPWIEKLCMEAKRNGFRAVILLTGHYGPGQQIIVKETGARMTALLGIPVWGLAEYFLAHDLEYFGDHAAWGETSLMMHLFPESVDLSRLGDAPHKGVGGRDPKTEASAADGKLLANAIIRRLAAVGRVMTSWTPEQLAAFADAESAIVARQRSLNVELGSEWGGWRHIPRKVFGSYGDLIAEGRFADVAAIAKTL